MQLREQGGAGVGTVVRKSGVRRRGGRGGGWSLVSHGERGLWARPSKASEGQKRCNSREAAAATEVATQENNTE
jgi:hypothetical protein